MNAHPKGWGITSDLADVVTPAQRANAKRRAVDIKTRDLAADLVEWVLANKAIPTHEAMEARFTLSKATACRWRSWLLNRFAGRLP